jgi:hypothetical protein
MKNIENNKNIIIACCRIEFFENFVEKQFQIKNNRSKVFVFSNHLNKYCDKKNIDNVYIQLKNKKISFKEADIKLLNETIGFDNTIILINNLFINSCFNILFFARRLHPKNVYIIDANYNIKKIDKSSIIKLFIIDFFVKIFIFIFLHVWALYSYLVNILKKILIKILFYNLK